MTATGGTQARDHGGGLDQAVCLFGGARTDWIDLSTGINPVAYPVPDLLPDLPADAWTALPDRAATAALEAAARRAWSVPDGAAVLAAPGASCLISRLPALVAPGRVHIPAPTYNEHAAAFAAHGWQITTDEGDSVQARVIVHPNNPTGHWWGSGVLGTPLTVIDESFADTWPDRSLIDHAMRPGHVILKSFGKFWGLAGLRLGFAIGPADLVAQLAEWLGPWPVSGPALEIGRVALDDTAWARAARIRLNEDAAHLDALMLRQGAALAGGTALFRLYRVADAAAWHRGLARHHIWTRIFPYADDLIRLGLPAPDAWPRIEAALGELHP